MIQIKALPITYKVTSEMKKHPNKIKQGIRLGFYNLGKKLVKDTSKDILRKPRFGRTYIIYKKGRRYRHKASVGGEAPANITGKLRRSLNFLVRGSSDLEFGYGQNAKYGKFLEKGTVKMAARPGLKINIDRNRVQGSTYIEQEIKKQLKVK